MANKYWLPATFAGLLAIPAATLNAQNAQPTAAAVLAAANTAMGGDKLHTLQYSATGYVGVLGQAYAGNMDDTWPRFQLKSYARTIDYDSMAMKQEQVLEQGPWPATHGGGQRPIIGERRQTQLVSGKFAWDLNGQNAVPQPTQAELRVLDIMMTPHGFIKAAMAAGNASVTVQQENSRNMKKVSIVSFKAFGKYPINGWINEDHMINKVQTWLPNPVFGDMFVELRAQGGYKDYGGVKFPVEFHQSIGDPPSPGLDIQITDVKPNIAGAALQVPANVQSATAQPPRVQTRQLAPGVWLLGGAYNSLAVEFKDFALVVEAPQDGERSLAVIAETHRLMPTKPIRYVINTHHHFDHAGGLREFAAEDALIVTQESNFNYYEGVVFDLRPRLVQPDRLSLAPRQVHYTLVKDRRTISDGERTIELMHMDNLEHANDMLMVWMPKEKIVVEADMYNPAPAGQPQPPVNAQNMNWLFNLERWGIAPETIVSIHTGVHPMSEFLKYVGVDKLVERGRGLNAALNE